MTAAQKPGHGAQDTKSELTRHYVIRDAFAIDGPPRVVEISTAPPEPKKRRRGSK